MMKNITVQKAAMSAVATSLSVRRSSSFIAVVLVFL
jgi:hypothetical protein